MRLYHYRTISSALLEIKNGTFHFASREEVNDPLEGYVHVYWRGDKAAWEGLLRNYICSVMQVIELHLLDVGNRELWEQDLVVDIHRFDNVPLGEVYNNLGDAFLADEDVQKIAAFYGNNRLTCREEEMKFILNFLHGKAIKLCIESCLLHGFLPEDVGNNLLKTFSKPEIAFPLELIQEGLLDESLRKTIIKRTEDAFEDFAELRFVQSGINDKAFLYGSRNKTDKMTGEAKDKIKDEKKEDARRHRNWLAIIVDFPKLYVNQLEDLIFPKGFMVCFSGKNDDSSMWGNYADDHRGVCLVYETNDTHDIAIKTDGRGFRNEKAREIVYGGEPIERNFFETFGRLTREQIKTWLTGTDGLSSSYEAFADEDEWRKRYWAAFDEKNYRKLKAWEHENEYRIMITNTLDEYKGDDSRDFLYDPKALKGIIFGIKTSEFDKKEIMKALTEKREVLGEFTFQQAEYDEETQTIGIRNKLSWKL